jgi:hypothetical protein
MGILGMEGMGILQMGTLGIGILGMDILGIGIPVGILNGRNGNIGWEVWD